MCAGARSLSSHPRARWACAGWPSSRLPRRSTFAPFSLVDYVSFSLSLLSCYPFLFVNKSFVVHVYLTPSPCLLRPEPAVTTWGLVQRKHFHLTCGRREEYLLWSGLFDVRTCGASFCAPACFFCSVPLARHFFPLVGIVCARVEARSG